jgi:hypothetical protein
VILQTHMGEIEFPDAVVLIKTDEQFAVPYGDVSGHGSFLGSNLSGLNKLPQSGVNYKVFYRKQRH